MKVFLTVILFFLVFLTAILVGAQNDQLVTINYLVGQSSLKLSALMAIMMVIGILLSLSIFSLFWLRLKWRIRTLERKQQSITEPKQV